jgi:addiction module HigA family antidote
MATKHQRLSKTSFPPGDEIRAALEARGWSQTEFAARIGFKAQNVNAIVNGVRSITPRTAEKFAAVLGDTAEYWMNLSPRKNGPQPQSLGREPCEMDEFRDRIIEGYKNESRSAALPTEVRRVIRIAIEAGITRLSQLNLKGYRRFENAVNKTYPEPATRYSLLSLFQSICRRGVKIGLIEPIAFPVLRKMKGGPRVSEASVPSQDDMKRLLDYLYKRSRTWDGQRLYSFVILELYTGLRKRAATRLLVEDVDTEHHTLKVRPSVRFYRGEDPGLIPLRADVMAVLVSWMPRTRCQWLFPGTNLRGPWSASGGGSARSVGPLQQLRTAGAAVGIPNLTLDKIHRFFFMHARPSYGDELDSAVKSPGQPCVEIRKDKAFIRGKSKGALSEGERLAVKALLGAFPERLTWKLLADKSGRESARRIVIDLRFKDPDWRDAIDLTGKSYPGCGSVGIMPW